MPIALYTPQDVYEWDDFVRRSANGTFLLQRGYMDYHAGRFTDHSLLIRDEEGRLQAVLPAHRDGAVLTSHAGLTYGGLVHDSTLKTGAAFRLFADLVEFLRQQEVETLIYRPAPAIYHRTPAQLDVHALLLAGGRIHKATALLCLNRRRPIAYQDRRTRAVRKALRGGVTVAESDDLPGYWAIVSGLLQEKYAAAPVHTLAEISLLKKRFPDYIRLTAAFQKGAMLAGVLTYRSRGVCRLQYIASSPAGRAVGALDAAVDHLVTQDKTAGEWLDFGSSEAGGGPALNGGLVDWKEGFGARTVLMYTYALDVRAADTERLKAALV
jgi:hypothetical protein